MQYFSPKGRVIHKVGIEPDHKVEITEDDLVDGLLIRENDRQLRKALNILTKEEDGEKVISREGWRDPAA
jgi:carboxyl-terminal processing protease